MSSDATLVAIITGSATVVVASITGIFSFLVKNIELKNQLKPIKAEQQQIETRQSQRNDSDEKVLPQGTVLDIIQLTLLQLTETYVINKSQAKNSFRISLFALVIGVTTIAFGMFTFTFQRIPNVLLTVLTAFSGILLLLISGAYLFLYQKSLNETFFQSSHIRQLQDILLAIKLAADGIESPEFRDVIIREIITSIIKGSSNITLTTTDRYREVDAT